MNSTVTLLKPMNNPSLLLPYEQYYIQSLHQEVKFIPEQSPGEINPLFQTVINPNPTFHINRPIVLQPTTGYHTTPAKTQRNTNTHRTRYV